MAVYKDLIKTELKTLKNLGRDRRAIEKDLGYSENYLDQTLSKGGNEKIYEAIVEYREKFEVGEETAIYGKINIATSQQETIERISKMLEKEQDRSIALENKLLELQNTIIKMSQSKQRASA